ncbi:hypothetical protein IFT63_12210 [Stenotrophomonas sp. CFBP 13724]|uniref:hypothetical protein n=1 Tax=Stenotrophomonas sp. CFBP 13724 TaxID=2775298 RepID=UPI001784C108|nr:hypothetical protein [Stenotrophomonas sp. CFBP 13724]MBD8644351.1 hypothetical protein [Stenotrophomonas sp. CFBP 13724]
MNVIRTLLITALLPLSAAAQTAPPLLPSSLALQDLELASGSLREFDIEVARSEKWLPYELVAATDSAGLSGTLLIALADGQPLREVVLDGSRIVGGLVTLPASTSARRLRISLRTGAKDMRADLSLTPVRPQLRSGQVVPVFPRRMAEDSFAETLELRLTKPSDVDLRTWGGNAAVTLQVKGEATGGGFPVAVCKDQGDAWRRCLLPRLGAGVYWVSVEGTGAPVNLLGSWTIIQGE